MCNHLAIVFSYLNLLIGIHFVFRESIGSLGDHPELLNTQSNLDFFQYICKVQIKLKSNRLSKGKEKCPSATKGGFVLRFIEPSY